MTSRVAHGERPSEIVVGAAVTFDRCACGRRKWAINPRCTRCHRARYGPRDQRCGICRRRARSSVCARCAQRQPLSLFTQPWQTDAVRLMVLYPSGARSLRVQIRGGSDSILAWMSRHANRRRPASRWIERPGQPAHRPRARMGA